MKNDNFKYILIPLPVMQEIFKKPKNGFIDIFNVGIYTVAEKIKITDNNAFKQLIYCYYREKKGLTPYLLSKMEDLVSNEIIVIDEDYNGFNNFEFNPEQEIDCLIEYINTDTTSYSKIIEFAKLRQVKTTLNMSFDIDSISNTYSIYQKEYNHFKGMPYASIKTELMFSFMENKSDFQKAVFAMYAGIRSLIGNKDYVCTTRDMIICRMFGAINKESLEAILKDKKVMFAYNTFSNRYQFEKILNYLLARNFLSSKIAYNKRTYLSCTLSNKQLADKIVEHINISLISCNNKQHNSELQAKIYIKQHLNK